VGTRAGEKRITTDHQAFVREIRAEDFGEVFFVKERGLNKAIGSEIGNLAGTQGANPVETFDATQFLVKCGPG